jgi:hypothetical protein
MNCLTYTVFEDLSLEAVRFVAELRGEDATYMLNIFRGGLGREPKAGDVWAGCRISHIGSDDDHEAGGIGQ